MCFLQGCVTSKCVFFLWRGDRWLKRRTFNVTLKCISKIWAVLSWQIGCVKECREDEFLCLNRAHCIPRRWRCDDVFDCMDHSDEENCNQGAVDDSWCKEKWNASQFNVFQSTCFRRSDALLCTECNPEVLATYWCDFRCFLLPGWWVHL